MAIPVHGAESIVPVLFSSMIGGIMKQDLMDILACPVCKEPLRLDIVDEKKGEVITGSLHCGACNHDYPVNDGIPNLLPPE